MTSLFPFADPLRRLENALRHCAADATAGRRSFLSSIEHLWALWQLYPDYHTRVVLRSEFRCHCRAIMRGLTRAMRRCGVYQLHPIYVCTLVLTTWLTQSSDFRRYADYLPLRDAIARVKGLFGDYTSGSKLCNRIAQCLNLSIGYNHEGLEHKWFNIVHFFQHHEIQRHHMTVGQPKKLTRHASASGPKLSTAPNAGPSAAATVTAPTRHSLASDSSSQTTVKTKYRLKTLEEHRFATRFEKKKKVTAETWRKALRKVPKLVQSGDRVKQADALYILLEIIALHPAGCRLDKVYLNLGSIYLLFDHLNEATKAYQQALFADSTSWKAHFNVGIALARLGDYVSARRHLEQAQLRRPERVGTQVAQLVGAIETIQRHWNEGAFRDTEDARAFTWKYLEASRFLATKHHSAYVEIPSSRSVLQKSLRSGPPTTPLHFDVARGWNGKMAVILHQSFVSASMYGVSVEVELRRNDPTDSGYVSIESFAKTFRSITRTNASDDIVATLGTFFPDSLIFYRVLVPNPETLVAIQEMKTRGFFYAGLSWSLFQQRSKRTYQSRQGGLWRWMELTLQQWILRVSSKATLTSKAIASVPRLLMKLMYTTPMAFVQQPLPSLDSLKSLVHADRGVIVYEIHQAADEIRHEACRTVQMFLRRVVMASRRVRKLQQAVKSSAPQTHERWHLQAEIAGEQEVVSTVFETLESLVDEVVAAHKREKFLRLRGELDNCGIDIPIRTENRHMRLEMFDHTNE